MREQYSFPLCRKSISSQYSVFRPFQVYLSTRVSKNTLVQFTRPTSPSILNSPNLHFLCNKSLTRIRKYLWSGVHTVTGHKSSNSVKMVAGKSPEWLPLGFTERIKVKDGRKIKVYTDTSNGEKFYSKPAVIRYLGTVDQSNTATEQIKLEIEDEPSLKSKISPQSMPIASSGCNSEKKNKGKHSFKMVVSESESADGIPPGWIIENRMSKSGNKIRNDRYYIDPNSGYIFSSKKDVLRYLETRDISNCATRPKRMECEDLQLIKNEIYSSSPDNNKLSEHIESERRLLAPGESDSGGESSSIKSPEAPDDEISESMPDNCAHSLEDNESPENSNKDSEMTISAEPTEDMKVTDQALAKTDKSLEAPDEPTPENSARSLENNESRENSNKDADMKIGTEPTEGVKVTDQALAKTDSETHQKLPSTVIEKQADEAPVSSRKSKKRKGLILPSRASKRLAGCGAEIQSDLIPSKQALRVDAKKSPISDVKTLPRFSLETAAADIPLSSGVSPSEEVATLTVVVNETPQEIKPPKNVEKPLVEKEAIRDEKQADSIRSQESQLFFGFRNSWPDPCLEFAFKTLTEEIPYEETLALSGCFRDRSCMPHNQSNEFSRPSDSDVPIVFQSGLSSPSEPLAHKRALDLSPVKNLNFPACSGVSSRQSISEERNKDFPNLPASESEKQTAKAPVSLRKSKKREDLSLPSQTSEKLAWSGIATTLEFVGEKTLQQVEPSNKVKNPLVENQAILDNKHKPKDSAISEESQLCYEFGSSWSDPCLEFAFKTLAGEIPIEDTFAFSGRFGNQFGVPYSQAKDPIKPSGSDVPTIFQNEIPRHSGQLKKNNLVHLLPGNDISFSTCSGVSSQQPSSEARNMECQTKFSLRK